MLYHLKSVSKALMNFKEKFGHCNACAQSTFSEYEYHSVASWVNKLRTPYKKMRKGGRVNPKPPNG